MTTQTPGTSSSPRATARDWIGLTAVLAATFMGQVDGFIVTIAAPSVQRDLPAGFGQVQLIGASYVLACAAGMITGGRLGDRYGRRRVFLLGVAAFTLASLVCGTAPDAEVLIAARFAQGLAAAALVPQELALVRSTFLDEAQRAKAIGAYGVVLGLGVIFGLAGGGFLVHLDIAGLGWRSAFLINVPIGVLILLLGRAAIAESRAQHRPGLDLPGVALTAVALPALLLPIIMGQEEGAAWWLWLTPVIAVAAVPALLARQRAMAAGGAAPLFPPRVFRPRGTRFGLIAIMTFFGGNAGLFLVFTYYVQTGLGRDPLAAGLMFVPLGVGFATGSAVSGRLLTRFGPKLPVYGCGLLAAALLTHLAVVQAAPQSQTVLLGVVIGAVGLVEGLVVSPLIASIFTQVDPDDAGALSGAAATATQFGLATGFAAVGSFYRFVLGATPGTPQAPTALTEHVRAYCSAIGVLVVLALLTGLLCARGSSARTPTG
ncbi:MFS transporter [Actinokineospora sp. PR83]|uniref:MFS transporter n=1 Tax=Actinokineospora sp. PR83 TaxID=2884908 RepID=UPI001F45605D|nr:MFS transporter [Actinokineospora sp. PR83]MCG8914474.1 MFS transporter [Actinokineospora sp. PR83]